MSELQVIGHSPGHAPSQSPRLRTDSLDSLGEEEGEGDGLSSSEGGSEAEEMLEGYVRGPWFSGPGAIQLLWRFQQLGNIKGFPSIVDVSCSQEKNIRDY